MNLGELLFDLNNEQKRIVNSIIRSNNKVSKATYAIEFNKRCLDENILPKYSNIYIYIYIYSTLKASYGHEWRYSEWSF